MEIILKTLQHNCVCIYYISVYVYLQLKMIQQRMKNVYVCVCVGNDLADYEKCTVWQREGLMAEMKANGDQIHVSGEASLIRALKHSD